MTRLRGLSGVMGMLDGPRTNFFLGFGRGESSDSVIVNTPGMELIDLAGLFDSHECIAWCWGGDNTSSSCAVASLQWQTASVTAALRNITVIE